MTIKARHVGFHPPITLPGDAIAYCDAITAAQSDGHASAKRGSKGASAVDAVIVPGNSPAEIARVRAAAQALAPKAQEILDLEARLSKLYNDYDHAAVGLWHSLTETRDYADTYAEKHDAADIHAIVARVVYHAGRAARRDQAAGTASTSAAGTTPATTTP
jgi:hypothetical protein